MGKILKGIYIVRRLNDKHNNPFAWCKGNRNRDLSVGLNHGIIFDGGLCVIRYA
jgi:hypothetical protein